MTNCCNAALIIGILLFTAAPELRAEKVEPRLRALLANAGADESLAVIVKMADREDIEPYRMGDIRTRRSGLVRALRMRAEKSQASIHSLLRSRGEERIRMLWINNSFALTATVRLVNEIALLPEIQSIASDAAIIAPRALAASPGSPEWNIQAVKAPELWAFNQKGDGVVVAIIDTGVDLNNADLVSKYRGGTNSWFDPFRNTVTPYDIDGHGTGVAGVILGGDAAGTAIGVAPGARWIAAKVFDDTGRGSMSNSHLAFQWLLDPDGDPDTPDGPDIVNYSWGLPAADTCDSYFQDDINALNAAGMSVIFAAGNLGSGDGVPSSISPANNPGSFSAGAVDQSNLVSFSSGRGPSACTGGIYPDIVAPGVNVRAYGRDTTYSYVSGTSFAAPHLTGVMALLRGAFPGRDAAEVENAVRNSATDLGSAGPDHNSGYGLLNAFDAYSRLLGIWTSALFHDYGNVMITASVSRTFTITNRSTGAVTVGQITLEGDGDQFSIIPGQDSCSNAIVPPGGTCSFAAAFTPVATGMSSATVRVPGDPAGAALVIALRGSSLYYSRIAVVNPVAGQALRSGAPVAIQWEGISGADRYSIWYSLNDGRTWNLAAHSVRAFSLPWNVPVPVTLPVPSRIMVAGFDLAGRLVGRSISGRAVISP